MLAQAVNFLSLGRALGSVGRVGVNAAHFVGILLQIKQVPLVTFGEVDQFVICGAHAEVLRHTVLAVIVALREDCWTQAPGGMQSDTGYAHSNGGAWKGWKNEEL